MRIARRHWLIALPLAVGLHAAAIFLAVWEDSDAAAKSAGAGGIEIALGPSGGAPGGAETLAPESEADAVSAEETAPAVTPADADPPPEPVETVVAEATETVVAEPTETALAEPVAEPAPVEPTEIEATDVPEPVVAEPEAVPEAVEPIEMAEAERVLPPDVIDEAEPTTAVESAPVPTETPVEVETAVAQPPVQTEASPIPAPDPPRRKPQPPEPTIAQGQPTPATQPAEAPAAASPLPATTQSAALPPGNEGQSGNETSPDAGSATSNASAGGTPGAQADYAATLLAWLERHKKYPRRAQSRRQQGVVLLYIVIDRNGEVLDSRIEESSGYRLLDKATIDMLKRANPLPAMPDTILKERLELVVPVQFTIS